MVLRKQLDNIDPSVKDALFRRLLREEDLSFLREDQQIYGFEVDLERSVPLSGFALLALQKHTILCYRSDLGESRRLVIFPNLDKLFDESFGLLDLTVTKKLFDSDDFVGTPIESGLLRKVVSDLTPPQREVDLPQGVSEAMVAAMLEWENESEQEVTPTTPPKPTRMPVLGERKVPEFVKEAVPDVVPFYDAPEFDVPEPDFDFEPPFDPDFDSPGFDMGPSFDDTFVSPVLDDTVTFVEPEVEVDMKVDTRATTLRSMSFEKLGEASEFVIREFGFDSSLVNQVATGAMNVVHGESNQVDLFIQLLVRLMDRGEI